MRMAPEPVRRWTWPHYHLGALGTRNLCRLLGGFSVHGRENIPASGGALICPNHISYFDPPVVGTALPRRTYFMAKKELFHNPVFGSVIRKCYAFPVDRESTDRESIRHAIDLLRQGELLIIFPEGQRSPDGSLQPAGIGPALIASRAGVPIVPCAVKETDIVLPRSAKRLHRGRIQVDFGPPLNPVDFGDGGRLDKDQLRALTEAVMQSIEQMQRIQYERVGQVAPPRVKELAEDA
jgi:1-acyl-sn-glycerol-3-phosphate acyltransferase